MAEIESQRDEINLVIGRMVEKSRKLTKVSRGILLTLRINSKLFKGWTRVRPEFENTGG